MLMKECTALERCYQHLEKILGRNIDSLQFDDEKQRIYVRDAGLFETISRKNYSEVKNLGVRKELYTAMDVHREGFEYDRWTVLLDEQAAQYFLTKHDTVYRN